MGKKTFVTHEGVTISANAEIITAQSKLKIILKVDNVVLQLSRAEAAAIYQALEYAMNNINIDPNLMDFKQIIWDCN